MRYAIVGGAYKGRSETLDSQECYNAFLEVDPKEPYKPVALVRRPGFTVYNAITAGEGRGNYYASAADLKLAVIGNTLYTYTDSTETAVGTLSTSSGQVFFADNGVTPGGGNQVMLVDGADGYIYNVDTDAFTNIETVSADFPDLPQTVTFQDGYFIVNAGGTGRFYISELYDGLSWEALEFATAEGDPDNLVAVKNDRRELWLFGGRTTEIWYNSGDADFPFSRYQGGFFETGCAAKGSVAKFDNSMVWLSANERGSRQFVRGVDGGATIISTPSVSWQLGRYSTVADARAYAFQIDGHEFYVCTFPTANVTWVYDAVSKEWFKWSYYEDGQHKQFRGAFYCFDGSNHIVLDHTNGNTYTLSSTVYADNSDPMILERVGVHLYFDGRRMQVQEFELLMETGVGLVTGQGSAPLAMLSWSKDGGHTYGNELTRSIGAIGRYLTRAVWRKIGSARDIVFKVKVSDPIPVTITGAFVRLRGEDAPE